VWFFRSSRAPKKNPTCLGSRKCSGYSLQWRIWLVIGLMGRLNLLYKYMLNILETLDLLNVALCSLKHFPLGSWNLCSSFWESLCVHLSIKYHYHEHDNSRMSSSNKHMLLQYYLSRQAFHSQLLMLGFGCFYNVLFCLCIKLPCCVFVLGKAVWHVFLSLLICEVYCTLSLVL